MKQIALFLALCLPMAASAQTTLTVSVSNPLDNARADQPVVIPLSAYGKVRSALVTNGEQEIPCQLDDLNRDHTNDELCFLADL